MLALLLGRSPIPQECSLLEAADLSRQAVTVWGSKAWAAQEFRGVLPAWLLAPRLSWCSGPCGFSGIWPWMPLYFFSFAGELIPAWYLVLCSTPVCSPLLFLPISSYLQWRLFWLWGFSPNKICGAGLVFVRTIASL